MRPTRMMGAGGAALALLLGVAGTASATGATPTTTTTHGVTETFHDEVPCVGFGDITIVYNSVEHQTVTPRGGEHDTFTQTGTFSAVLDAGGTATGKFTIWGNFNTANGVTGNSTFTFNGHVSTGIGAGTNWHDNAHFTGSLDEAIDPIVAFDRFRCS